MARLLIVDGDQAVLGVLRQLLSGPGREVLMASSAEEAADIVRRYAPEVALIDKNLNGAPGLELPRQLKQIQPDLEIIVTAGYASLETAIEAVRLGAFDYLTKPIDDYRALSVRVQSAIDRSLLRRSQRALLERLMESELRHRRLIEAAPDALLVCDAATLRIQDVNPAAVELYGYSADELVRLDAGALGPAGDGRQRHRRKNGEELQVEIRSTEYTENRQLVRVLAVRRATACTCAPASPGQSS